jgi:hypothetical protein
MGEPDQGTEHATPPWSIGARLEFLSSPERRTTTPASPEVRRLTRSPTCMAMPVSPSFLTLVDLQQLS